MERKVGALELGVLLAVYLGVLLAQAFGALFQKNRVIRLGQEDGELPEANSIRKTYVTGRRPGGNLPEPNCLSPRKRSIHISNAIGDFHS